MSNDAITRLAAAAWAVEQMSDASQYLQMINITRKNEGLRKEYREEDERRDKELEEKRLEDGDLKVGDLNEKELQVEELEVEGLDKAIKLARTVTDRVESAQPDTIEAKAGPTCFNVLGFLLGLRYNAVRDPENLEDSIRCFRRAVEGLTDEDDDERSDHYRNLTASFVNKYRSTDNEEHLVEAIEIARILAHGKVPGTRDSTLSLNMVKKLYLVRFKRTGNLMHLDEAIAASELVLEHWKGRPNGYLDDLKEMEHLYHEKYRLTGDPKCLDRAALRSRYMVDTLARVPTTQDREQSEWIRSSLRDLKSRLVERYQVSEKPEDLRTAIGSHGKALAECSSLDQGEIGKDLWAELQFIFAAVFAREGNFKPLIHESILEIIRILAPSGGPGYRFFLLRCGREKRIQDESEADEEQRKAAVGWLSGIADMFEESWRQTGSGNDIELAVELTFWAMDVAPSQTSITSLGTLVTKQRARSRMWSDHTGKFPDAGAQILSIGGKSWIPGEISMHLGLESDAIVNLGMGTDTDLTTGDADMTAGDATDASPNIGGVDSKPEPKGVSGSRVQSRRSLRKSRAEWRAMEYPRNIEKVFKAVSHSDPDSDSCSGTQDSDSSDSDSDPDPDPDPEEDSNLDLDQDFLRDSKSDSKSDRDLDPGPETDSDADSNSDSKSDSQSDLACKPASGPIQTITAWPWPEPVVYYMKPEDLVDNSPSRLEWLRQKRENNEQNLYLDQVMSMVGRENVKAHFLAVKARVQAQKRTDVRQEKLRLHLVLSGKAGTGKRYIGRLYAQFLFSIGAVRDQFLFMTPEARLCSRDGVLHRATSSLAQPEDPLIVLYNRDGLPNFYSLPDGTSSPAEMEDCMKIAEQSVLVIMSGSNTLFQSIKNSEKALQELQTPLTLPDYTDDELRDLLVRMMQKRGFSVEGRFENRSLRALVQRVAQGRESKSFSNVYNLQNELEKACRRRAFRLQQEYTRWFRSASLENSQSSSLPDQHRRDDTDISDQPKTTNVTDGQDNALTAEDLLGPEPKEIRRDNASWKKLQEMIGLDTVKRECGDIIDYAQINYHRELLGMEPLKIGLHRLFLGPPGVGKTTVAQLYGQLLIDLGLVSGSKIMLRNPVHLIGAHIGESEKTTKGILDEARGNVLIIDDAHMLYPGSGRAGDRTDVFRISVLNTLVANVSADPEDRCIILVGSDREMGQLFNNNNPGLQRRFPKETAIRFETYSEDELCQIMKLKADKCGLEMTQDARAVSRQVLSRMRINPRFGNAGDVENLLNTAKVRLNARLRSGSSHGIGPLHVILEPGDIDPHWDRALRAEDNRAALFQDFVGFRKIVEQFKGYQELVDGMWLHGIDPKPHVPWSFIFKGPPGTGKTSTARKVGRLYYDMGLLSTDEVVVCSVTDLIGQHVGETGPKVLNTLETSLGKVLLIDEAYRLAVGTNGSSFHREAIGELVDAMTQPRYQNHMVIILAGYTTEMELLLRTNPGLRSRFSEQIIFQPMTPQACFQYLRNEIEKLKIDIVEGEDQSDVKVKKILQIFEDLSHTEGWASGRDVETLARKIIGNVYRQQGRFREGGIPTSLYITIDELVEGLRGFLREREGQEQHNDTKE